MTSSRIEAFSDGVIAIIITIMVLELKIPSLEQFESLKPLIPIFCNYVLSFIYVGIYWNNHHHLFQSTKHITGGIMWANLHLLFWLSLIPSATACEGQNFLEHLPTAIYGFVLLMAAMAYYILQFTIIAQQGADSILAKAVGKDWKGKISPLCYLFAIPLAFVYPMISLGLYVAVPLLWLVPDRRIERVLHNHKT